MPPHIWDASATPVREAMTWQRPGHGQAGRAHPGKRRRHRASYAGRCHQEYVTAGGIGSALLPIQPVAIYDRSSRNPGTPGSGPKLPVTASCARAKGTNMATSRTAGTPPDPNGPPAGYGESDSLGLLYGGPGPAGS